MTTRALVYNNSQINDRLCAYLGGIAYGADAGFYNTDGLDTSEIDTLIATITAASQKSAFAIADIGTNPPAGNLVSAQITDLDATLSTVPGADAATREIQNDSTATVLENTWRNKNLNMWNSVYNNATMLDNFPRLFHFTGRQNMYVVLAGGTATAGATSSLTDSGQNFNVDTLSRLYLAITGGTGAGEIRQILNNTATVITPVSNFAATLDNTSVYEIRGYVNTTQYAIGTPTTGLTATSGAATTITRTGSGWTTNQFANMSVRILSGTGAGQERLIKSNTATALTVVKAWGTNPDNTSVFQVVFYSYNNSDVTEVFAQRTADIFSATTIGLTTLSLLTNVYGGMAVEIVAGTGSGQRRTIASNNGTTLTVSNAFGTTPDATSQFRIVRFGGDWGYISELNNEFVPYDLVDYYLPLAFNVYLNDPTNAEQLSIMRDLLGLQTQAEKIENNSSGQNIKLLNQYIDRGRTIYQSAL